MNEIRTVRPRIRTVESGTRFHAGTDRIMAVLALGAAVVTVFYFRQPGKRLQPFPVVFNPDAPGFNPFAFVSSILFLIALRYAILAALNTMRGRKFGQSTMEMEGETVAPGETLKGVVRVPVDLAPLGDYELRLRCVEQARSSSTNTNLKDYIRGEQTLRVPAKTVNPEEGIPFAFMIPSDARITSDSSLMTEGSVRWILEVKAPLKGLDFYAIFGVHVRIPLSV